MAMPDAPAPNRGGRPTNAQRIARRLAAARERRALALLRVIEDKATTPAVVVQCSLQLEKLLPPEPTPTIADVQTSALAPEELDALRALRSEVQAAGKSVQDLVRDLAEDSIRRTELNEFLRAYLKAGGGIVRPSDVPCVCSKCHAAMAVGDEVHWQPDNPRAGLVVLDQATIERPEMSERSNVVPLRPEFLERTRREIDAERRDRDDAPPPRHPLFDRRF